MFFGHFSICVCGQVSPGLWFGFFLVALWLFWLFWIRHLVPSRFLLVFGLGRPSQFGPLWDDLYPSGTGEFVLFCSVSLSGFLPSGVPFPGSREDAGCSGIRAVAHPHCSGRPKATGLFPGGRSRGCP